MDGHRCYPAEFGPAWAEFGFVWAAAFCACGRALGERRLRRDIDVGLPGAPALEDRASA